MISKPGADVKTKALRLLAVSLAIGVVAAGPGRAAPDDKARVVPPPTMDEQRPGTAPAVAVVAGGCFWGVQGVFQHLKGVTGAISGYAGGPQGSAKYDLVSGGATAHAESVQITYDPRQITFGRLLQVYFSVAHDPTERNRQGPDVGPQYPLDDLSTGRRAGADRQGVYRAAERSARIFETNRHHDRVRQDVLSGGGLSPGLPDASSTRAYIVINDLPKSMT